MAVNIVSTIDYSNPAFDWETLFTYLPGTSYSADVLPNGNTTKVLDFTPYLVEGSSDIRFYLFDNSLQVAFEAALNDYATENL